VGDLTLQHGGGGRLGPWVEAATVAGGTLWEVAASTAAAAASFISSGAGARAR
jgi:hypothetical protein